MGKGFFIKNLTQNKLIVLISIFFVLFYNYSFFDTVLNTYPLISQNQGFVFSLPVVLFTITALFFTLLSSRWTTKPLLISTLLISSMTAYFMNTYQVVIDDSMIRNALQTDIKESMDLFSFKQVLYFILLGLLPAYFVYKTPLVYKDIQQSLWDKFKQIIFLLLLMVGIIFIFSKHYTSFAREHKRLRFSANPSYWIYSVGNYIYKTFNSGPIKVKVLGTDAKVKDTPNTLPKLVILVVGEAVRADHLALNGYDKDTTPKLRQENIINFSNVYSCGTATAESVPCMFSIYDKEHYSYKKGIGTENILDVLNHTNKISILWRDNNSDSKGVALRVPYEYYKSPINNTICTEGECRDEGMLIGLNTFIHKQTNKDILIVLHQMGNHGPAYYKRYPKAFEKFTPVCETNQLEQCSKEEISNAYDNAILYTDDFLTKTIDLLKKYDKTHQTAMLYMSDHGESLGEKGIYLHGLPYFMAPDAQKHIAALAWFSPSLQKSTHIESINPKERYSQDNLFHTLLGLFDVSTEVYNPKLDIFNAGK